MDENIIKLVKFGIIIRKCHDKDENLDQGLKVVLNI